ncbi:MAG: J domain-containing protein [Lachnospiraceae bacterium]|nr:J domain-containing protein [Lachnospiraceae bacterium]
MTARKAYQVLGLPMGAEKNKIKKKYRKLMMQVHPDVGLLSQESYQYSAQEINNAYAVLMKERESGIDNNSYDGKHYASKDKKNVAWDAPVNENAFMEREVLQYVEDYDGIILGTYCVAKGKYLWKTDEDFPLFLRSMYQCSKELLDEIDEKFCRDESGAKRQQIQAELTYLLAQQFIDTLAMLTELAEEEEISPNGERIFYLSSMLELTNRAVSVKEGEAVYPSRLRNHKLYLKNQDGQELGYLSFSDDRMYYLIIPLFEQKRVQVKMQAAEIKAEKRKRAADRYQKLHLWIKLLEADNRMPESLNLQIERLLSDYNLL